VNISHDVIVEQQTESGKSLCFQLPSLFDGKKIVVVITPTISLINSQLESLRKLDIDAIALGRAVGPDANVNHLRVFHNDGKSSLPAIVYMTPEHFANSVSCILEDCKSSIKLLVLNEVHKMFDRHSEFRSSYDCLNNIKEHFPDVPVMALTATLDNVQLKSLCEHYLKKQLSLKEL
jgi:superfamily II DNA helicase RecQ